MRKHLLIVWTFVVDQYALFLKKVECTMRGWALKSNLLPENAVEVVVTKARMLAAMFFFCWFWIKQIEFQTEYPIDFSSRVFFWKWLLVMISTKMARMMMVEQCSVSFNLCCSTAVWQHLRARAAPDRPPPPPARRSPLPAAVLRPKALRGFSETFLCSCFCKMFQHFAIGSLFCRPKREQFQV